VRNLGGSGTEEGDVVVPFWGGHDVEVGVSVGKGVSASGSVNAW
jgi:hypothetical protein